MDFGSCRESIWTMNVKTYNDPFRGVIELRKVIERPMSAMGEHRTDGLWKDDRGGVYWFVESTAAIDPIEPVYVPSYMAEMIGKAVGMRKKYFGEGMKCLCDPSTYPPLEEGKFTTDTCWKCDAFRDRKPKEEGPEDFSKRDWEAMQSCVESITKTPPTQQEMEAMFTTMPQYLQVEARKFGMNDWTWRLAFTGWLEQGRKIIEANPNEPRLNGLSCPECGAELLDSSPQYTLLSFPAQKKVHCSKCDYKGFRTV